MSLVAMPEGSVPLVLGTVLALGALTLVLSPLLSGEAEVRADDDKKAATEAARVKAARAKRSGRAEEQLDGAVAALREIEFDRETGKLSDSDYAELKTRYTREALAELRAADVRDAAAAPVAVAIVALSPADAADPVEAAIRRARENQRSCGVCGPRPEPDATFCSSCGRYLPGACAKCGTSVDLVGSRFCSGCGDQLAAA
ncbi:zinc ribbon domain-containing protein [Gemmatimonas groenlandica]|uniref:Zinc ribbon domain-containing protein n=1 Tax=Gemmatimonas groenlandica TaxID=2732249 RepID=A0A6M4IPT7_9BACT|nr:zinc ribbon domain-containing protein [Gemmatimonas groenlandica]QJR35978.1 zinc ribbon domain-containing protein [Gemmatimonas groenlandica]